MSGTNSPPPERDPERPALETKAPSELRGGERSYQLGQPPENECLTLEAMILRMLDGTATPQPMLQAGPKRFGEARRAPGQRQSRLLAVALTIALHLVVLAVLLWPHAGPPTSRIRPPPAPIQISLVDLPKPTPPGPPNVTMTTPRYSAGPPPMLTIAATPTDDTSDLLSESQLAGAATVGEGGGGTCDIARAVQQALRRDPMVRTAVADAHRLGKAIMLWNGDWVRSGDQDGKGLSAVREAIMWEVAFAPEACRNTQMHGLVLLSLADGGTRFAVGASDWQWSDLLGVRAVRSQR